MGICRDRRPRRSVLLTFSFSKEFCTARNNSTCHFLPTAKATNFVRVLRSRIPTNVRSWLSRSENEQSSRLKPRTVRATACGRDLETSFRGFRNSKLLFITLDNRLSNISREIRMLRIRPPCGQVSHHERKFVAFAEGEN